MFMRFKEFVSWCNDMTEDGCFMVRPMQSRASPLLMKCENYSFGNEINIKVQRHKQKKIT